VEGLSVLDKRLVLYKQLSWQLAYLNRSVMFRLLPIIPDY
jgi:hypothetical protein